MKINQETQYTANFATAVEQLGAMKTVKKDGEERTAENIEVRLGAIYALERVMQDSARDAGPIVETLAAYVRENCGEPVDLEISERPDNRTSEEWREWLRGYLTENLPKETPADRSDVRAAMTVLGRRPKHARKRAGEEMSPDLRGANLQGAHLFGSKLAGMDLRNARVEGANLWSADLEGANQWGADLEGAVRSDFTKAIMSPGDAPAQFAETWGHRARTKLPKGVPIPDHWPDTDDILEWLASWRAYKKSLGL